MERNPALPPTEGLLDLFNGEAPGHTRVATVEPVYGAAEAAVKWLKVPATGGPHLCTLCVRAIHAKPDGPSPLRATARRRGPNDELLLCPEHAQLLRERDAKAEAVRKARVKASSEGYRPHAGRLKVKPKREHA